MCNRSLHSQKKQGRAFGIAHQVLDAAGQTFAEAFHIKARVDVSTNFPQTWNQAGTIVKRNIWSDGAKSEPGWARPGTRLKLKDACYGTTASLLLGAMEPGRNQLEPGPEPGQIEGCLLRNHHFL